MILSVGYKPISIIKMFMTLARFMIIQKEIKMRSQEARDRDDSQILTALEVIVKIGDRHIRSFLQITGN
jgi:hypothetical protein